MSCGSLNLNNEIPGWEHNGLEYVFTLVHDYTVIMTDSLSLHQI